MRLLHPRPKNYRTSRLYDYYYFRNSRGGGTNCHQQ
jgi:hypothetical protein